MALLFLNSAPLGFTISKPGAVSRARWMGKAELHNFLTSNTMKFFNISLCKNSTVENNIRFLNEDPEADPEEQQHKGISKPKQLLKKHRS